MPLPLLTRSLRLAPFTIADAADLFAIRGDPDAMRFWDWPCDTTRAQTREHALTLLGEMEAGTALHCTVRLRDGGFVGVVDLSELDQAEADLGFMVVRSLWGRGFATEAAGALVEEAWRRSVGGLKARIHADNESSRRLLLRLGFRRQGPHTLVEAAPGRRVMCEHFRLGRLDPVPVWGSGDKAES